MAESINIIKEVYNKEEFIKTVNTTFSIPTTEESNQNIDTPTVAEFFNQYNQLFYQIPKEGPSSHTTLIQQSQEYVGDEQTNDESDALIQEINGLRQTVLEQQETIFNLTISGSTNG